MFIHDHQLLHNKCNIYLDEENSKPFREMQDKLIELKKNNDDLVKEQVNLT